MGKYQFDSEKELKEYVERFFSKKRDYNPKGYDFRLQQIIECGRGNFFFHDYRTEQGSVLFTVKEKGDKYLAWYLSEYHFPIVEVTKKCACYLDLENPPPIRTGRHKLNVEDNFSSERGLDYPHPEPRQKFYKRLENKFGRDAEILPQRYEFVHSYLVDRKYLYFAFYISGQQEWVLMGVSPKDVESLDYWYPVLLSANGYNYNRKPETQKSNNDMEQAIYKHVSPEWVSYRDHVEFDLQLDEREKEEQEESSQQRL